MDSPFTRRNSVDENYNINDDNNLYLQLLRDVLYSYNENNRLYIQFLNRIVTLGYRSNTRNNANSLNTNSLNTNSTNNSIYNDDSNNDDIINDNINNQDVNNTIFNTNDNLESLSNPSDTLESLTNTNNTMDMLPNVNENLNTLPNTNTFSEPNTQSFITEVNNNTNPYNYNTVFRYPSLTPNISPIFNNIIQRSNRINIPNNYRRNLSHNVLNREYPLPFLRHFLYPLEDVIVRPSDEEIENASTILIYNNNNWVYNNNTCPISLEEFEENDILRKLNVCGHIFKQGNIDRWFEQHVRCPVCRHDIRENTINIDTSNNIIENNDVINNDISNNDISNNIFIPNLEIVGDTHDVETNIMYDENSVVDNMSNQLFNILNTELSNLNLSDMPRNLNTLLSMNVDITRHPLTIDISNN
jgi:hypothetical protein